MVVNEVRIHPGGLVSTPCKYVDIFSEKAYQLFLLLMRQLSSDLEEFLFIVANNDFLQLLTPFAAAPRDNSSILDCYKPFAMEAEGSPPI